jgi:hypothetical protein
MREQERIVFLSSTFANFRCLSREGKMVQQRAA